jgi:glycine C-acetyltransferase
MSFERMDRALARRLEDLERAGTRKGAEPVIVDALAASGGRGPRVRLAGEGERLFLRMNSNGYLGLAEDPEVVAAEERTARVFGAGPQAVRFISGTYAPHVELEQRLADFHGREAAMIYSAAYAAILGTLPPLVDERTAVVSDALNHNCIINATRLARPGRKSVYAHNDLGALEGALEEAAGDCDRAIVVTDGVFSMRGDHAPLDRIAASAPSAPPDAERRS